MTTFSLYDGDVQPTGKGREISPQTQEYRRLLVESVTSGWITIEGSTIADLKKWTGKLRPQAQTLNMGMKFGTTDDGEICFRAHEFEEDSSGRRVPKKHIDPPAKKAPAKKATPRKRGSTASK